MTFRLARAIALAAIFLCHFQAIAQAQQNLKQLTTQDLWHAIGGPGRDVGAMDTGYATDGARRVIAWDRERYEWRGAGNYFLDSVDAGPKGTFAGIRDGKIYLHKLEGAGSGFVDGSARDIGVGANGRVWIIGTDSKGGGGSIFYRAGNQWRGVDGGAVRIDVDPGGNPWVINDGNEIYRWDGRLFQRVPGKAIDIGIGADGTVMIAGSDSSIWVWDQRAKTWKVVPGKAKRISVDAKGRPWIVGTDGMLYAWNLETPLSAAMGPGRPAAQRARDKANRLKMVEELTKRDLWQAVSGPARDVGAMNTSYALEQAGKVINWSPSVFRWTHAGNYVLDEIDAGPKGSFVGLKDGNIYFHKVEGGKSAFVPGKAKDIGIGANGLVWVIGSDNAPGGGTVHYRHAGKWHPVAGSATRIDVDPDGNPWVVNNGGRIFRWAGKQFQPVPGRAVDIGIGADGTVMVVGTNNDLFVWDETRNDWLSVPGRAKRISVDAAGRPWIVGTDDMLYAWNLQTPLQRMNRYRSAGQKRKDAANQAKMLKELAHRNLWRTVSGPARDVGVMGKDAYAIAGNGGVVKWDFGKDSWEPVGNVRLDEIDAGPNGSFAGIVDGRIYFHKIDGRSSGFVVGRGRDIAVSPKGLVWVIGTDKAAGGGSVFYFFAGAWHQVAGSGTRIDVDPDGNPWIVNSDGRIFRWTGRQFDQVPGKAIDIGIGGDGTVMAVGTENDLYAWDPKKNDWQLVPGKGKRISVDSEGRPWIVGENDVVFAWNVRAKVKPGRPISASQQAQWRAERKAKVQELTTKDLWTRVVAERPLTNADLKAATDAMKQAMNPIGLLLSPITLATKESFKAKDIAVGTRMLVIKDHEDRLRVWNAKSKRWDFMQSRVELSVDFWGGMKKAAIALAGGGVSGVMSTSPFLPMPTEKVAKVRSIAVSTNDNIYGINDNDDVILFGDGRNSFQIEFAAANDIGVGGPDEQIWIVGHNSAPGGYDINRYRPEFLRWDKVEGGGVRIDVGPDGNPWIINDADKIYRWHQGRFVQVPGKGIDIAIGGNGVVVVVGTDKSLHVWDEAINNWRRIPGAASVISVDAAGNPVIGNSNGEIFYWAGK